MDGVDVGPSVAVEVVTAEDSDVEVTVSVAYPADDVCSLVSVVSVVTVDDSRVDDCEVDVSVTLVCSEVV